MNASEIPISIVIPAFNQLEYCRQCVYSIKTNTQHPYRLFLVDNASTDGVAEFFDSVEDAEVVHSEVNRGFAGGVNLGIERAEGHIVLLNSDTIVPEGWLTRLEAALTQSDDIGIVGPRSNCVSGPQEIPDLHLNSIEEINAFSDELAHKRVGELTDVLRLVGFCLLIRDQVADKLGGFDEAFAVGNFEDDDYCLRATREGYRLCIAEDSFVFHYGNRTFAGMGITDASWDEVMRKNQKVFEDKWKIDPVGRLHPAVHAQKLNRQARQALAQNRIQEALDLLRHGITLFPSYAPNHNDLGAALYVAADYEAAFSAFCEAVRLKPDYSEARDNLRDLGGALEREDEVRRILKGEHSGD